MPPWNKLTNVIFTHVQHSETFFEKEID